MCLRNPIVGQKVPDEEDKGSNNQDRGNKNLGDAIGNALGPHASLLRSLDTVGNGSKSGFSCNMSDAHNEKAVNIETTSINTRALGRHERVSIKR